MAVPIRERYRLLVVDADPANFAAVERVALPLGFDVEACPLGAGSLDTLLRRSPHLALVDLTHPDANGLELLRRFRRTLPGCPVVVTTATGSLDEAVEAIKQGARDYLTKPLDAVRLESLFAEVLEELDRRAQGTSGIPDRGTPQMFAGLIGRSTLMQEVFAAIQRLAPHSRVVLIVGETGTGKDLVARAFHQTGPRSARPFVRVHCSALDDRTLADAAGATLCLDEVADLEPDRQALLLRRLEEDELRRKHRPLGAQDLAVVATTRRDLRAEVAAGRFRDDLLYRLNVVEIGLPPLRARRDDIPLIAASVIREMAARTSRPLVGMTQAAERLLTDSPWPGNVRELRGVVERACLMTAGPTISARDIETALKPPPLESALADAAPEAGSADERERIVAVLEHVRGNRLAAAKLLGISRRALYRRLERYQIGAEAPPRRAYLPRAR